MTSQRSPSDLTLLCVKNHTAVLPRFPVLSLHITELQAGCYLFIPRDTHKVNCERDESERVSKKP